MKNIYRVLMLVFLAYSCGYTQTWTAQTSPVSCTFYSVKFINNTTGWAVGSSGKIIKTTDGGTNWTAQTSGTTNTLHAVFFLDANTGWTVGSASTIRKTTDGGTTWTTITKAGIFNSVFFANSTNGWVCTSAGGIFKSTDGGATWNTQTNPTGLGLTSLFFVDANTGYAVGNNDGSGGNAVVIKTTDGGTNWSAQTSGTTNNLTSVYFVDANTGYAVDDASITGNATIIKTTNGGTDWATQTSGTLSALQSVCFVNANTGYAVGADGTILFTNDGGATWTSQTSNTTLTLNSVVFTDMNTLWTVGGSSKILKSINGTGSGFLDPTFGTSGQTTTLIETGAYARALAIQGDGKIVAVGSAVPSDNPDFAVARYNSAGALDATFGTGGTVTTAIGSFQDVANAVALQTDGKIVAAGYYNNGTNYDFAVARYTIVGVLDATTFGSGGIVTTPIGSGNDDGFAVVIQTDGKIVVGGWADGATYNSFALVRYTTTGTLDGTFGTGGIVTSDFGNSSEISSMALQSDGKIVAVGRYWNSTSSTYDFALARYTTLGALDGTFGTSGMVTTSASSSRDELNGVVVDGNGKIVVAGRSYGSNVDFAVARYTSTGSLDATFGTGGITLTNFPNNQTDIAQALSIQPDNKIVAAGYSIASGTTDYDFAVARYNTDGTIDNSFGTNGKITFDFSTIYDKAYAIAIQPDYKIVVAGETSNGSALVFGLARLKNQESPLPVELTSFTAKTTNSSATLHWQTATEMNNYGFEIERRMTSPLSPPYQGGDVRGGWQKIGFVQGAGTSNAPREYNFTDQRLSSGRFVYRLKQIDNDGSFKYSQEAEVTIVVPKVFALSQNYPNPFNPSTTINFTLAEDSHVSLRVFDMLGREVQTLVNGEMKAGEVHNVLFDASKLSSGLYFYRLETGKNSLVKKLVLMK